MSTKFITLTGTANWTQKLFTPDDEYNTYQFQLVMDDASVDEFNASGSMLKARNVDDGVAISPKRKADHGQPRVVDEAGDEWPEDTAIGNGSKVSCILEMYSTKRGWGTKLEAVRVEELVEFKPDDFDPNENAQKAREAGELPF